MSQCMLRFMVTFNQYLVENFHSFSQESTKETDRADLITEEAKEADACWHKLHHFKCTFVPLKNLIL